MPPKPDKDKGKKEEPPQDDGSERELVEKELIIGYLKSKLGRYQEHGDHLQIENIKLSEELETQKLNLRDINEFLTNELKARSLTTSALESKVYELSNVLDEQRKSNEALVAKLRADKEKELEGLRAQLAEFERKSKTMQDFLDRKEAMENEIQSLKNELAAKIKEYDYRLTDLDRAHIQDREKWKRETAQKVKDTKIQMMKLTDNQLEMTTKRTIMENEQMSIELHYQSRQTEKLMSKNTVLCEENQDLRQQLALSKQTQEELARRNNVYQKTIKSLLSKLQEQGCQQDQNAPLIKALEERIADLELAQHLSHLTAVEQAQQIETLQARLTAARSAADAASDSQDAAVRLLTMCLEDVRAKMVSSPQHDDPGVAASQACTTVVEGDQSDEDVELDASLQPVLQPCPTSKSARNLCVSITENASFAASHVSHDVVPEPSASLNHAKPRRTESIASTCYSRTASCRAQPPAHRTSFAAGLQGISDAPELIVPSGKLEELSLEQRERVLSFLLEKMHTFMQHKTLDALGTNSSIAPAAASLASNSARYGRRASTRIKQSASGDVRGSLDSHRSSVHDGGKLRRDVSPSTRCVSAVDSSVGQLSSSGADPSASWPAPVKASSPSVATTPTAGSGWHNARSFPAKPNTLLPSQQFVSAPDMDTHSPLPAVDDLLAQVMADVRPWGKKTNGSPLLGDGKSKVASNLFLNKSPIKASNRT